MRNIKPIEKTVANPARHSRRLFSPSTFDKTVIAMVGRRQATTVDTDEVNFSILLSEYVASVCFCKLFGALDFRFLLTLCGGAFSGSPFSALFLRFLICFVKLLWNGTKSFATHRVKPSILRRGLVATRSSSSASEEGDFGHRSLHSMLRNWRFNDKDSVHSHRSPHVDCSPFPPMQKPPASFSLSHVLRVFILQSSGSGRAEI